MIADLHPYPSYKDSGVEWLGDVPRHWSINSLRRKLKPYDGIKIGPFGSQLKLEEMSTNGYKVYTQANVITKNFNYGTKFITKQKYDELNACEIKSNDIVVTMMGTSGRCALVPKDAPIGVMDSHLLRLRFNNDLDLRFLAFIIDEAPYLKQQIFIAGKGSIMHGLNSNMIKNLSLAIPPLSEQTAIVRYLDYMDRRIRRYINAKKKLIALLEEEKQAIIHNAVTRGLDPDVRLKPSGVEWLGDVPEHWELLRFKSVMKNVVEQTSEAYSDDPYIALENVESWTGRLKNLNNEIVFDSTVKRFQKGDVLFGKLRPYLAKVTQPDSNGVCVGEFFVLRPYNAGINVSFMERLLRSKPIIDAINNTTYGAKMPRANWHFVGGMIVCIPPLPEQVAIVYYLDKETDIIDETITRTHRQITLLQEYRTRLIADVVTGKLDVREAAAHLPEESGESDMSEPLDELNSMIDDETSPEEMECECESDEAEA